MAVKNGYSIPVSLDRSMLDHEITIASKSWSAPPIAMKVLLFWFAALMGLFWTMSSTWISSSHWALQVLWVLVWLGLTAFLGKYNATKELNAFTVPAFLSYAQKQNRQVISRSNARPADFYSVARIDEIDETGFIRWNDGSVGQAYLVVGSASILVFDEDKQAMIDRVDAFWRKADAKVEYIFMTTKEPQKVHRQMASLGRANAALENRDPELFELLDERYDILKHHVGGRYNSIHQYLIIKGDNLEALRKAHTMLRSETEKSSLMIKECSMLDQRDTYEMLRTIYRA